jgi:hypothetical protein
VHENLSVEVSAGELRKSSATESWHLFRQTACCANAMKSALFAILALTLMCGAAVNAIVRYAPQPGIRFGFSSCPLAPENKFSYIAK